MAKIDYKIIATGSTGNATIIDGKILIDCGVPFKALYPYYKGLLIVLLTHIHGDHFKKQTISALIQSRPSLRFACGEWLVKPLIDCGVPKTNIDVLQMGKTYNYDKFKVSAFNLTHNVPNCGYKLFLSNGGKVIYATDTNALNGVIAPDFDLYLIEANYDDEKIRQRIKQKELNGEYAYEKQVLKNHLSKKKCDDFIMSNIGSNGVYVYMHRHVDKLKGTEGAAENDGET